MTKPGGRPDRRPVPPSCRLGWGRRGNQECRFMTPPRPTVPADVPGILELVGTIYAEYDTTLDAENEDTHLLDPGDYCRRRGGEFWVIEEAGRIVRDRWRRAA